jgi:hypothetical protein
MKVPNRVFELKKVKDIQRTYIEESYLEIVVEMEGNSKKRTMK